MLRAIMNCKSKKVDLVELPQLVKNKSKVIIYSKGTEFRDLNHNVKMDL